MKKTISMTLAALPNGTVAATLVWVPGRYVQVR